MQGDLKKMVGRNQTIGLAATLLAVLALAESAQAFLQQPLPSDLPRIQAFRDGTTEYNHMDHVFTALIPEATTTGGVTAGFLFSLPVFSFPFVPGDIRRFSESTMINLVVGIANDGSITTSTDVDLIVVGRVEVPDGNPPPAGTTLTGTLLTAKIVDFGWQVNSTGGIFFFQFQVTGGELADAFIYPEDSFLGVTVTSENSDFDGSFGRSFGGGGNKISIGGAAPSCLVIDKTCCIPPPTPAIDGCQGHVLQAVFEYTGTPCPDDIDVLNNQGNKHKCSGDLDGDQPASIEVTKNADKINVEIDSPIPGSNTQFNIGANITFEGIDGERLKASLKFDVISHDPNFPEDQSLVIHTSCSQNLNVCDEFGSMKLVSLTTSEGGTATCGGAPPSSDSSACELPDNPVGTVCESRPVAIAFEYTGRACEDPLDNPQAGKNGKAKAKCSGDLDGDEGVTIQYTGKDPSKFTLEPMGPVSIGTEIRLTATGRRNLHADSNFLIMKDSQTLQMLTIHTSCSKTLALGDEFGGLRVIEFETEDGEVIGLGDPDAQIFFDSCEVSAGGRVEYQYELSNPGSSPVTVISVDDSELGELVPVPNPVLGPFGMLTLFETVVLQDTTTNTVEAEGIGGGGQMCSAEDSVTVEVVAPPSPPFRCTKPIDEITMIWDGNQVVDVRAYKGTVGSSVELGFFPGVVPLPPNTPSTPANEVSVSGYTGSPNDVFWAIFETGTNNKLGESNFHLSCSDPDMNDNQDCGKRQGDGKQKNKKKKGKKKKGKKKKKTSGSDDLINDWLFEGLVDAGGELDCTLP